MKNKLYLFLFLALISLSLVSADMPEVHNYLDHSAFDKSPNSPVALAIQDYYEEFLFGDKKNSENLFVERWYQLLKPNGRFGAVLPESVYDTTENKYIRLFIYKYLEIS